MVEVGFFSLLFGLCLALYALALGSYCLFESKRQRSIRDSLTISVRNALIATFFCILLSSVILWTSIFFHDFSVQYVYEHSAIDMPPYYLFTSFWSALEGSHLLWTLAMSAVVTVALLTVRKSNKDLYPALCVAFALALSFMLFLCVTSSAPLTRLFPVGKFGQGMNGLLQNPYMAIHPPILFTAYSMLVVPFAYSFAALLNKKLTSAWLQTVRRWSLLAWAVLSVAIFLGGKWAYVELGWAGYWAWDPVENSSFMPWIALTAALHTLLITDKTGRLPRLLVFLTMFAFILSFQGTFITRSGIISSVHSFAESNIGPIYLTWILFLLFLTIILLFTRGYFLKGAAQTNEWRLAKESILLFTNFFLLFLLALVFIGTLLPLIIDALTGTRISIQQPFFNAFAPWIGAALVSLLGVGNLLRWKSGKIDNAVTCLLFPFLCSIALTTYLAFKHDFDIKSTATFLLVIWTGGVLIMDCLYKFKNTGWNSIIFLKYNRPYIGAFVIHIGFLVAVAGFAGHYRGLSADANLNLHESVLFNGYTITNEGLAYSRAYNAQYLSAQLKASNNVTGESVLISPVRTKFTNSEQWFNEIGVSSTLWHDLYIVLASFDIKTQSVSLKLNWNPTVKLVWISVVIMVLGALISLSHGIRRRSIDLDKVKNLLLLLVIGAMLLSARQALSLSSGVTTPDDKIKIQNIESELRCPTCQGVSVLESETPQSKAIRAEIEKQVSEGKSKEEIINYFTEHYGPWILREPDAKSPIGFFIWSAPILVFILGPLIIFLKLRKSKSNEEIC